MRVAAMRIRRHVANIFWLGTKELRSFLHDVVLLGFVIYTFTIAIYSQAQGQSQEVHNASIAIADESYGHRSSSTTRAIDRTRVEP